jgi:hypothetical protein
VQAGGEEEGFSKDLMNHGNLPFSVDSAQLAGLFVQAVSARGSFQMVEVRCV